MTPPKELQRVEAFSDGVFAIACTLLVLEITVPHLEDITRPGALWPELRALWPSFLAYVLSFGSILIAWAGHHRALSQLVKTSKPFIFANGFLLLTITFMPFPTALLAEYITTPQANVAVTFYSASWLVTSIGFCVWWVSLFRPVRLLPPSIGKAAIRKASIQIFSGGVIYACTTAIAYWFPIIGFLIIIASELLWIVVAVNEDEQAI